MKRIKLFTNETFDRYVNKRRRVLEDRYDSLDFDDVVDSIEVPSKGEIQDAIRELDLFDDVAKQTGAKDIGSDGDGKLRLLDLDPKGRKVKQKAAGKDDRFKSLDFRPRGSRTKSKQDDPKDRDLDLDPKGRKVSPGKKSGLGNAIGRLDYDDDIDTTGLVANVNDIYVALASTNPSTIKSVIVRFASEIDNRKEIVNLLLNHATSLNLNALKVLCGAEDIDIPAKYKDLDYVDAGEISKCVNNIKNIASSLTGANNSYGLIPNAIVATKEDQQTACINVIDFCKEFLDLPIEPIYVRGSIMRHSYRLAEFLLEEVGGELPLAILTGGKGLIARMAGLSDIPKKLFTSLVDSITSIKQINSGLIEGLISACVRNGHSTLIKRIQKAVGKNKFELASYGLEDSDSAAYQELERMGLV